MAAELTDPAVAAFVTAVDASDGEACFAALTDGAAMSDDAATGVDLRAWAGSERRGGSLRQRRKGVT
ncbi:hypothetical protein [Streptomyces sp. NPDC053560]|uniref:hypothetical protein n=1 Tax=Streptomyces sp. NPDC053560 TaxID=3365711 RepID=UPI0037D2F47A